MLLEIYANAQVFKFSDGFKQRDRVPCKTADCLRDRFDGSKPPAVTAEDWTKWRSNRNRLPNLHLLEGRSNGSKNAMRLVDYYNDMNDVQKAAFRNQALIPADVSLEIEQFEEFYEKRKTILTDEIRKLLI